MNSKTEFKNGSRYFVIKSHQWRGNLRRLLVIEPPNVATYDLAEYKLTNSYYCNDIREFHPIISDEESMTVMTGADQFFLINFPNNKMKFKSKYRSDILTDLFKTCPNILPKYSENVRRYNVLKHRWNGENYKVVLEIGIYGVNKIHSKTNQILSSYDYKDIYRLIHVRDSTFGPAIIISTTENEYLHLFIMQDGNNSQEMIDRIRLIARKNIGVVIPLSNEPMTFSNFQENCFGIPRSALSLPIHSFIVNKIKTNQMLMNINGSMEECKKIMLAFTDNCLIERDSTTNTLINVRRLIDVYSIVRPINHSQKFAILYLNGDCRFYTSTERDSLLASLMDSVRSSGNANVSIKLDYNHHKVISQPEIEVARFINSRNKDLIQALEFFIETSFFAINGNVFENESTKRNQKEQEKFIHGAISELLFEDHCDQELIEFNTKLLVLKNLFTTRAGFAYFIGPDKKYKSIEIEQLFRKVKKAFDKENDVIIFTVIDMLSTLMQPVHDENDLFYEQKNKGFLLSSKNFLPLILDLMRYHINKGTGALIISAILDFLTYALCAPYSETTDGGHFDQLLNLVSQYGRCLFRLFDHQSLSIVKATCLLMKAMIEEGNPKIANEMQKLALAEGTFLFHLHASLYPIVTREKFLPIQILSRKLISLWTVDNDIGWSILQNIFPLGLLNYFESKEQPPADTMAALNSRDNLKIAQDISQKPISNLQKIRDQYAVVRNVERHLENAFNHWRKRIGIVSTVVGSTGDSIHPIVLRRRREYLKSPLNWNMFFYQFTQNHSKPDLIWNYKTREELRESLEKEITFLKNERELHSVQLLSWNFDEFEVHYVSLDEELKIGNYYLRLLLSQGSSSSTTDIDESLYIKSPIEFFNALYHRFLSNSNVQMKADCLQAMSIIYEKYDEEIGSFSDVTFLLNILHDCRNRTLRDRIVQFIGKIIKQQTNIRTLLRSDGLLILIDLATLSHLHVNRAVIPTQTNVIEASPEMSRDSMEKEWHVSKDEAISFADLKDLWKDDKISGDTKCWAQGYNSWRKISEIAQLKWTLMAEGLSIFQENNMTIYILDTLIRICERYPSRTVPDNAIIRPIPKVKQILSDESCLPHIVHLLLTFDPVIVERIATLIYLIIEDNPRISLLYQTGLFYFILMYTGSNILPISRVLHLTHMKQSFKSDDQNQTVLQRSILSQMIPEAMVCYLENYGPEEFSKVFLGEFDTPEVIWNYEMRRFMIEKISAHIVDFSPRLYSNVRAIYQYCPIPPIRYQQLENELFCNIYYLKNLCDTKRFNDWKIKDPVTFLRDILEMWKLEISKKPNSMQIEDAFEILGIKDYNGPLNGHEFESMIRKRYYTQAQRYHPDKNADGREMFEKVNEAYYFLFNAKHKSNGPDIQNIILILKTQSILFSRYNVELYQYKYAGYPMLLKTLELELNDQYLFSKTDSLLAHACKTVYYTVKCSALNAEELRRENGLQMLYDILNRCVSVLSSSSKSKDLCTKVCKYIISTFGVSAEFPACRSFFYEMTSLAKNIFYILNYKHLTKLSMAAIDCVIYFSNDPYLQMLLFKSGCLFSLIQFIFKYDYTLEENAESIGANEKVSKQFVANSLAKKSLSACVALFENRFDRAQGLEDKSLLDDYSLIRQAIYSLLTPYIANQLNMEAVPELLKLINSNIENPYFIWNNASRAELLNYLQTQEKELLRSGVCMDESFGTKFVYSCHKEELIISDIFVRIYNKQPNYPLNNVKQFVLALLDNIGTNAQYLHAVNAISFPTKDDFKLDEQRRNTIEQCLTALINLLNYNAGIEHCFVGHFRNIFSLLRLESEPEIQSLVLRLLMKLSTNKDCIQDISNSNVLINLLLMLHITTRITEQQSKSYLDILEILLSFTTNSDLVKEGIGKGILLYVLQLFIMPNFNAVREKAAQLLIKITGDVVNGQYSSWVLSHFLPTLFFNAMKDAPQNAINLYDENKENPELIWTEDARLRLNKHVRDLIEDLYTLQISNPSHLWKFNANCEFKYSLDDDEFKISGVYLRLYNKSPGWILSRPKEFLLDLLEYAKNVCDKSSDIDEGKLEMVNNALHILLTTQSDLLILIPPTGYIQIFINKLDNNNLNISKTCLSLIHKFSLNSACLNDMIVTGKLAKNFNSIIETHPTLIELLCDSMVKIFEAKNEEFIHQSINTGLINNLLKVLDSNASQSTKAKVVQMFQTALDSEYNSQISEVLNNSNIWKEFKDQKHDLFIASNNATHLLTNSTVNIAGYLKQSSTKTLPLVPPPIEE
uniref:DnaJ homolog subfamily C member 13-like n=1 Tax=Dermatophagoides pteronyssinus TaxID=6956 RepID=A0A6P6YD57_DERPT|nr:dnaJ homolog subfamily C member 13-like [Dermatophagoides pteronyssinus]